MSSLNDDDILIAEKYLLKIINNERLIKIQMNFIIMPTLIWVGVIILKK